MVRLRWWKGDEAFELTVDSVQVRPDGVVEAFRDGVGVHQLEAGDFDGRVLVGDD